MFKIGRDPNDGKIRISGDINYSNEKNTWIDGIYIIVSSLSITIWFSEEAEEKLKEFL